MTRGNRFEHYKVTFEKAPEKEDYLNVYDNLPEDAMREIIGERVSVACKRTIGRENCSSLTRLAFKGRELYSRP